MAQQAAASPWNIAVTHMTFEDPASLLAHPANATLHPQAQEQALEGAIQDVGFLIPVCQNDVTQHILDGHGRIGLAISRGVPLIPVNHLSIPEELEPEALATINQLTRMGVTDKEAYAQLLADIETSSPALQEMLSKSAEELGLYFGEQGQAAEKQAPDEFGSYGDDIETQFRCPSCSYEWSGKPK